MATYLIVSGMLFYYLLKPPYSKKKTTIAEGAAGVSYEKPIPILLKDPYTAQEAKTSV